MSWSGRMPTAAANSSAALPALNSCTMRRSGSEAVTTSFSPVGTKFSVLKTWKGTSVAISRMIAQSEATRPLLISVVVSKRRSSPAEPPISGMSSSAQWKAAVTASSANDMPSIRQSAKRPRPGLPAVVSASSRFRRSTVAAMPSMLVERMLSIIAETMVKRLARQQDRQRLAVADAGGQHLAGGRAAGMSEAGRVRPERLRRGRCVSKADSEWNRKAKPAVVRAGLRATARAKSLGRAAASEPPRRCRTHIRCTNARAGRSSLVYPIRHFFAAPVLRLSSPAMDDLAIEPVACRSAESTIYREQGGSHSAATLRVRDAPGAKSAGHSQVSWRAGAVRLDGARKTSF